MLQLTHTLTVNPPHQPALSRDQLWSGLMLRVLEPTSFVVGLERADILEKTSTGYRRALHFGEQAVYDTVTVISQQSVEFITDASDRTPSGRLLIQIVEDNATLGLCFSYNTQFPEPSTDEERHLLALIQSAYMAADADTLRIIREQALTIRH